METNKPIIFRYFRLHISEDEPYSSDIKLNLDLITKALLIIFEFSVLVYLEDDLNVVSLSLVFKMLYNNIINLTLSDIYN